jgi:hypothetical protein
MFQLQLYPGPVKQCVQVLLPLMVNAVKLPGELPPRCLKFAIRCTCLSCLTGLTDCP